MKTFTLNKVKNKAVPVKHFNEKQELLLKHGALFPSWACSLAEGFSLLLYGFGSKRPVLSAFMTYLMEADSEAAVVEVLGYSPHFTMKELLVQVSQASGLFTEEEGMNVSGSKKSISTLAKRIIGQLRKSDRVIMLFVNNIEGQNLRNDDCQGLIAKLAELPNVYLVATADNAFVTPLLWNQKVSSQLNFHYYHVPTYCSYEDELMYQDDIAFQENDGRRLQAASVVLSSLTQTARTVFRQLAEYQLSDHPGGLPFSALFTVCREQLILSNEITLRSHLEEFIDHDLVCLNDASHENLSLYKIPLRTGDIERLRELCI
mmetsp:Transcript_145/g.280  ORF Transcript_145/g.280 Transcript_145/m.280 type:complete len:318 (-) Transcript_145:88-1041(-)